MKLKRANYLCLFVGFIAGIAVSFLWGLQGDPWECVIENMRGQPSSMQEAIANYCVQRFGEGT